MPVVSYILDIEVGEVDSKEEARELARQEIRRRAEQSNSIQPSHRLRVIDMTPKFEPEPKYSEVNVSIAIFADSGDIGRVSI